MGTASLGFLLLVLGQAPPGDDYYAAATAAGRELSRQVEYLQRSFANIPGPDEGRGLYQQTELILVDVTYLRQQIKRKVGREDLYLALDKVDGKINSLLDDLQGFAKWVPAVRMAVQGVQAAQHDMHFALSAGDGAPARQSSAAYRQTLVLKAKAQNLEGLVRYVFYEQDSLPGWTAGFKDLRGAINALQDLQNKKASRDDLKQQMLQVDKAWDKLVTKMKALPEDQNLLLVSDFARVDAIFDRLSRLFAIQNRRAPLKDPLPY
jgi:hypothetical protein